MTTNKLTLALTAAATIGVMALGGAAAFASAPGWSASTDGKTAQAKAVVQGAGSGNGKIAKECLDAEHDVAPGTWRAGARIDVDQHTGFLVIRTDKLAAVCVIEDGKGAGIMGGDVKDGYDKLTAARPFDYLTSMNYEKESIHFGIASSDVTAVSLIAPDKTVTSATLVDGTFLAKVKDGEDSNQSTTNHVRATLANGQVVEGPFRH